MALGRLHYYPLRAHRTPHALVVRQGGRTRWAHQVRSSGRIARSFCCQQMEDLMNVKGIGEKAFLKLKPLLTITQKPDASGGSGR